MKAALQHASLCWLAHAVLAFVAIALGPWPLYLWLPWAAHVALQVRAAGYLRADLRQGALRAARPSVLLCHAPGLLLSAWSLGIFAGLLAQRFPVMVGLQIWTAAWTPLITRVPRGGRRAHYLWVVAALPWLEAAAMLRLAQAAPPRARAPLRERAAPEMDAAQGDAGA